MMQPGLSVQNAMRAVLVVRPSLTAIVDGKHIYDEVPRGATIPNVIFSAVETRDWSVAGQKCHENFITIDINSKSRSMAQAQNIIQEIESALDMASLSLVDHVLVNLRCIFISSVRRRTADYFTAQMRFRAATEPV